MGPVESPASAVKAPLFEFSMFSPEYFNESAFPPSLVRAISQMSEDLDLDKVEDCLGTDLFDEIFKEHELKAEANEYVPYCL